ncbi:Alpha/Beta hydrolase protein [Panaeolus papilionaceus]|nr:Alpha/Beta hydrolase protein [Panaeolus papilionaceus]
MSSTTVSEETPFRINIPDAVIQSLKAKLALTTFPDELDEAGWTYGVPLANFKRLVARWQDGYDWRKHEKQINDELPQFRRTINVDGFGDLGIHYVHQKSTVKNAIPLLFVHGWPGSFLEVRKILPLLTRASAEHPGFHVVALSLPNFGFSDGPSKKGFAMKQYAEVGNKLMLSLGYQEYVTQGGDWGHMITKQIASTYGDKYVKAWHSNFPRPEPFNQPPTFKGSTRRWLADKLSSYTPRELEGLKRTEWFTAQGRGYYAEQSTQPQTLGYSLADSPAGLLAWIYEKLVNWTDSYPWEDDEVLTWVSVYWFSKAGPAASVRIYYEYVNMPVPTAPPTIPRGLSFFPRELILVPKVWLWGPDLVFQADHESGGHFAAHERPNDLVDDLRKMFGKGGPAYKVVKGKSGYDNEIGRAKL